MDRKVAKEFLHVRDWLDRAGDIVGRGEDAYPPTVSFRRPATR